VESGFGDRVVMVMMREQEMFGAKLGKVGVRTWSNHLGFMYFATTIKRTDSSLAQLDRYAHHQLNAA